MENGLVGSEVVNHVIWYTALRSHVYDGGLFTIDFAELFPVFIIMLVTQLQALLGANFVFTSLLAFDSFLVLILIWMHLTIIIRFEFLLNKRIHSLYTSRPDEIIKLVPCVESEHFHGLEVFTHILTNLVVQFEFTFSRHICGYGKRHIFCLSASRFGQSLNLKSLVRLFGNKRVRNIQIASRSMLRLELSHDLVHHRVAFESDLVLLSLGIGSVNTATLVFGAFSRAEGFLVRIL